MMRSRPPEAPAAHGDVLTAISDGMLQAEPRDPRSVFMSGNQQEPDLMCEVFILGPTDLLDDHEVASQEPSSPAA